MRVSQFFLSTLKEAPAEAELVSHKLMLRAGMIKKLGSGLYTWMPLGLRVLRKVENIVREEMNRSGAAELSMPAVQPAELWHETGRWAVFGPQMLKMKDRHERDFCFGPTHEEVITDIARKDIKSYRQLPVIFYQIQTKFRDEIRPRFGVIRAREFLMKDAYSFDANLEGMLKSYQIMYDAYARIFTRLGLRFRAVAADTGAIGGSSSHEFQALADSGEDAIAYCPDSGYAANIELAEAITQGAPREAPKEAMRKVPTPGKSSCEDVAVSLGLPLRRTVKCLMVVADGRVQMLLVRGDHSLNEVKAGKLPGFTDWRWASDEEIIAATGCKAGYLGPVGFKGTVIADRTVAAMSDLVCGANVADFHLAGVNWSRDLPEPALVADVRNVLEGDASPDGKGKLKIVRGIEVGHVFALGSKYSESMGATFTAENGETKYIEMGCYGIGVSRIVAACIEQNHDERGIIWPEPMAPFSVAIAPIGYGKSEAVRELADLLHDELGAAGIEVLMDDRDERPGVMFADLELIGIPHRVTIGDRGLKEGMVEFQSRRDGAAMKIAIDAIAAHIKAKLI
jgi:prolyl-tRNA synthetase